MSDGASAIMPRQPEGNSSEAKNGQTKFDLNEARILRKKTESSRERDYS